MTPQVETSRELQGAMGRFLRLTAIAACCLLVSCIDGREEIWLNSDGSGRADVTYSLPAAAARFHGGEQGVSQLLEKFLKNTPALTSSAHEVTTEGDRLRIRVRASFDSALDLQKIPTSGSLSSMPASVNKLAGEVKVGISGRTVDFTRKISPGEALPGAVFMPASQFEGHHLSYIIHLPTEAVESNATRTEDQGRTLVWEYPMSQAIRTPFTTRFKAKIPIPTWLPVAAGIATPLAALLAFVSIRRIRSARKSRGAL
jgi:hypothetical protein